MTKKTTSKFQNRLKAYSTLAGAAVGVAASAQISYQDIDPDKAIDEPGDFYDLDLNQDGTVDFRIENTREIMYQYGSYSYSAFQGLRIRGFGKNNRIQTRYGKAADTIPDSTMVGGMMGGPSIKMPGPSFRESSPIRGQYIYNKYGAKYTYTQGYFHNTEDKYIGLQFLANGAMHTGWVRLSVEDNLPENEIGPKAEALSAKQIFSKLKSSKQEAANTEELFVRAVVKDFAYNKIPFGGIMTGVGPEMVTLPQVSNIVATDSDDKFNGADIEVTFDAAADEANIDRYGCIIVKSEKAESLTLDDVVAAGGGSPRMVTATGDPSYAVNFYATSTDLDGDVIVPGRAYKVVVFGMDDLYEYNIAWEFSNEFTLSGSDVIATDVSGADIGDAKNASDLQVSFTKAADETGIDEYRIMIVPSGYINNFDSAAAANTPVERYTAVTPDGTDKQITLDAAALTYNNWSIGQNSYYYAFVVSHLSAGGVVVSAPSPVIRLSTPAPVVTEVNAADVNDYGNAGDIEVSFRAPADLTDINYAYVIIIPKAEALELGKDRVINLQTTRSIYYSNMAAGQVYTTTLRPYYTDGFGRPIVEGVTYYAYVRSNYRNNANSNSLSEPAEFTLTGPLSGINKINVVNNGRNFNPSDWLIAADRVISEFRVSEYRIMAVPSASISSFDLTAAEAVAEGNYVKRLPNKMDIWEELPVDMKDVNGNAIDSKTEYQFVILTVGKDGISNENQLSDPSLPVSLEVVNGIEKVELTDGAIFYNNGTIRFGIEELNSAAKVQVISMNGQLVLTDQISNGQASLEASVLKAGIYVVRVQGNDKFYVSKLLVK